MKAENFMNVAAEAWDRAFCCNLIEGSAFSGAVSEIPERFWEMPEAELLKMFRPTGLDLNLKYSLWLSLLRARGSRALKASEVYDGLCTYAHWHQNVLKQPAKLAWMLRPHRTYQDRAAALVELAAERLREMLSLPVTDPTTGGMNPDAANVVLGAASLVSQIAKTRSVIS